MAKKVNLSKARCRPPSFILYEREFSFQYAKKQASFIFLHGHLFAVRQAIILSPKTYYFYLILSRISSLKELHAMRQTPHSR